MSNTVSDLTDDFLAWTMQRSQPSAHTFSNKAHGLFDGTDNLERIIALCRFRQRGSQFMPSPFAVAMSVRVFFLFL